MYKIPLSATPVQPDQLAGILHRYEGMPIMKMVEDFETAVREFTKAKYVLALNSGTSAIHLALKAAGVGKGDVVIVSSFTYVASVNPIIYLGAIPVFIDSEENTWNIDPELLEEAIKEQLESGIKPKTILVVHAYGMPANMHAIMKISQTYDIPVIEDAAEAFGSMLNDVNLGTMGQSGVFSFNNNKLLTCYGGGALITNQETIYLNALKWASQARENKPYYEHKEVGFNYRMPPLSAAQGLLGLSKVTEKINLRRKIFENYALILRELPEFRLPKEPKGYFSNRWLTTLLAPKDRVKSILNRFASASIETRPLWNPMHEQPVFQGFKSINRGISLNIFKTGLTLPSSDNLTEKDQETIGTLLLQ